MASRRVHCEDKMLPALLFAAMRDRRELSEKEIAIFIQGFAAVGDTVDVAARQRCVNLLDNGAAYERWCRMVQGQGGNPDATLPVAPWSGITADRAGVVSAIDTEALGLAIISLGGGRRKMGDPIDHSVGLEMLVRLGDVISFGTPLVRIFSKHPDAVTTTIRPAITIGDHGHAPPLIVERI